MTCLRRQGRFLTQPEIPEARRALCPGCALSRNPVATSFVIEAWRQSATDMDFHDQRGESNRRTSTHRPRDLSLIKRLIEAGEVRRAVFDR